MAEEHRCQAPPEGPRLCANNCGFFGSSATLGLCSKCYRDHRLKEDQEATARMAVAAVSSFSSSTTAAPPPMPAPAHADAVLAVETRSTTAAAASPVPQPGRCKACGKRVGLTGFRCRCGETYCGSHRYAEQHGCTFDFKSAGRDAIARSNPVVKAHKLDKI